jgi:NAD(P)H-dependent flavin oxidoreductase YrpB (nitropropane dioxygenase family)
MLKTAICYLLEIEYPLIAAGMGGIALAEPAAARDSLALWRRRFPTPG